VEAACEFCGRRYVISLDELKELRQALYRQSLI
jgi:hypothetical protein